MYQKGLVYRGVSVYYRGFQEISGDILWMLKGIYKKGFMGSVRSADGNKCLRYVEEIAWEGIRKEFSRTVLGIPVKFSIVQKHQR